MRLKWWREKGSEEWKLGSGEGEGNEFSRFTGDTDLFRTIENYLMRMGSKRGRKTNLFVQDQCLIEHTFITRTEHMAFYNYQLD